MTRISCGPVSPHRSVKIRGQDRARSRVDRPSRAGPQQDGSSPPQRAPRAFFPQYGIHLRALHPTSGHLRRLRRRPLHQRKLLGHLARRREHLRRQRAVYHPAITCQSHWWSQTGLEVPDLMTLLREGHRPGQQSAAHHRLDRPARRILRRQRESLLHQRRGKRRHQRKRGLRKCPQLLRRRTQTSLERTVARTLRLDRLRP